MRSSFLASVEVIEFHTTDAYSNLGLKSEKYKINKLSRVENEKVILRMRPKSLIDEKTYNKRESESIIWNQ
jgi:hypothetical protein